MANDYYDEDETRGELIRHRIFRGIFAIVVYLLATGCIFASFIQWRLMLRDCNFSYKMYNMAYLQLWILFLSVLVIGIFVLVKFIRLLHVLNWIVAAAIVEGITFSLAGTIASTNVILFDLAAIAAGGSLLAVLIFGSFVLRDLTADAVAIFAFSILMFASVTTFALLYIICHMPYAAGATAVFIIFFILTFALYHAQLIAGGRYAEIRYEEYLSGVLIIYFDFTLLFLTILYALKASKERTQEIIRPHKFYCNRSENTYMDYLLYLQFDERKEFQMR